jgi:hypothetical protein
VSRLNVHVERVTIERRTGIPTGSGAIAAALRSALEREFARDPGGDLAAAIERAVRSAFGPPARGR